MKNISLWESITQSPPDYPALREHIEVDVAIVGAGITGITAALQLHESGKKVALLESSKVGSGTTGFSTGNLYIPVQPYYQHIQKKFNDEAVRTIAHSRQQAINYIEKNVKERHIECHFHRRPFYFYTNDEAKFSFLEQEITLLQKVGIETKYIRELPLSLQYKKAAVLENQARFNPLEYVIGLAKDLSKNKQLIFENTHVQSIEEKKTVCILKTSSGKVTAKKIILATHTPIGINLKQLFTAPYRSYVIAVELKDKIYPEGQFWNLEDPHYVISTHSMHSAQPELLLIAGNHHKTGQGEDTELHYADLEKFLRNNFAVANIAYRWSAQHYQAADDVPYIGLANHFTKNIYMATGYFADGLVYGTLAGIILANLIREEKNTLSKIYNSNRIKPIASSNFLVKEGSNVFLQYLKDMPKFKSQNFDTVKCGEGKIIEIDQEKWAVSRDEHNKLHIVSAVCTHMKGIVNWNNAEKTWDCPCHGSRFSQEGKIIEGPAISDLKKKTVDK